VTVPRPGGEQDVTDVERATKQARRPMRADARRNYDLLVRAARDAFRDTEADTSLEQIARRAGVGIGTLYRHFPTRLALLEAVYRDEVDDLGDRAAALAETAEPFDGVVRWLDMFLSYAATKRALFHELIEVAGRDSELLTHSRAVIEASGSAVLARAQEAGEARADVTVGDLTRLVGGCTMMPGTTEEQQRRMLDVIVDGIRVSP
jgi:AcrR family transcriptional regulator